MTYYYVNQHTAPHTLLQLMHPLKLKMNGLFDHVLSSYSWSGCQRQATVKLAEVCTGQHSQVCARRNRFIVNCVNSPSVFNNLAKTWCHLAWNSAVLGSLYHSQLLLLIFNKINYNIIIVLRFPRGTIGAK